MSGQVQISLSNLSTGARLGVPTDIGLGDQDAAQFAILLDNAVTNGPDAAVLNGVQNGQVQQDSEKEQSIEDATDTSEILDQPIPLAENSQDLFKTEVFDGYQPDLVKPDPKFEAPSARKPDTEVPNPEIYLRKHGQLHFEKFVTNDELSLEYVPLSMEFGRKVSPQSLQFHQADVSSVEPVNHRQDIGLKSEIPAVPIKANLQLGVRHNMRHANGFLNDLPSDHLHVSKGQESRVELRNDIAPPSPAESRPKPEAFLVAAGKDAVLDQVKAVAHKNDLQDVRPERFQEHRLIGDQPVAQSSTITGLTAPQIRKEREAFMRGFPPSSPQASEAPPSERSFELQVQSVDSDLDISFNAKNREMFDLLSRHQSDLRYMLKRNGVEEFSLSFDFNDNTGSSDPRSGDPDVTEHTALSFDISDPDPTQMVEVSGVDRRV